MVVGRNIGSITEAEGGVGSFLGRPKESLDLVTRETSLRDLEDRAKQAKLVHKASQKNSASVWNSEIHKVNEESMYQITMNRLAGLSERVKVSRDKELQLDVVNAVRLFHAKKAQLRRVEVKCEGPLDWWRERKRVKRKKGQKVQEDAGRPGKFEDEKNKKTRHKDDNNGGNTEPSDVVTPLVNVMQWPSNDFVADDFLNPPKPKPAMPPGPSGARLQKDKPVQAATRGLQPVTLRDQIEAWRVRIKEEQLLKYEIDHSSKLGAEMAGRNREDQHDAEPLLPMPTKGFSEGNDGSTAHNKVAGVVSEQEPEWQGVTLRGDVLEGSVSGVIELPRFDYFEVSVVVSKTRPMEQDQGASEDNLTIYFGTDLKKLTKVAVVANEVNAEDGTYRHEVKHHMR